MINNSTHKICKCELEECLICPPEALKYKLCSKCNTDFYPKENDENNFGTYFKCYKNPIGYYFAYNIYKECYNTCSSCNKSNEDSYHNCLACNSNFPISFSKGNSLNCYKNCTYYYYFDSFENYYCTDSDSCPDNYKNLIPEKRKCIDNCINDDTYKYEIDNICYKNNQNLKDTNIATERISNIVNEKSHGEIYKPEKSNIIIDTQNLNNKSCDEKNPFENIVTNECVNFCSIEEIQNKICIMKYTTNNINTDEDIILKIIELDFTSDNYDTSFLDSGQDSEIKNNKTIITLTTNYNQKNNNNMNISKIHLENCESLLRNYYNLSENETLYMIKIDVNQEGIQISKIEFDIYARLNRTNLLKLDKKICQNTSINILLPILLNGNIDKYNISSDYFSDVCYSEESDSGTDIILSDRKIEFIKGNKTVCQEECNFSNYDYNNNTAICSCRVKETESSIADMNIDLIKIYESFVDYNKLKDLENIEENDIISIIESEKNNNNLGVTSCNVLSSTKNIESNPGFYSLLIILVIFIIIFIIFCCKGYRTLEDKIDKVIQKQFRFETKDKKSNKNLMNDNKIKAKVSKKKARSRKNKSNKITNESDKITMNKKLKNKNILFTTISFQNNMPKKIDKTLKPDTDYELNWLSYKDALLHDKREFCEYYCSLIQMKQLFFFTFCSFNDYNSGIIKKFIFFLSFALHYTVNALFFNDSTFHQIYKDEGDFNFKYILPQIIYCSIISIVILRLILQFLVLTDKDVLEVKNHATKLMALNMKKKKLKCIIIKFTLFFIINFILLTLFWYYLTCFNAVYKNSQVYLIESTLISFFISLLYPFIINIIPTVIRMNSINSKKKSKEYSYKISQIIQVI